MSKNPLLATIALNIVLILMVTCAATDNSDQYSQLVSNIQGIQQDHNIPGLALIIVDKQGITHQLYLGLADRNKRTPVKQSTVFRIGSITKTITALAALKLEEQGLLNLQAPVSTYLEHPPYKNTFSYLKSITVDQLLENSAGFRDLTNKEFDFKEKGWSLEQSFNYDPNSRTTAWLPGQYYSYSNNSAGIVAKVIESITHQSYEEYVNEHIFTPLNLNYATFFNTEKITDHLATGYNTNGTSVINYWHMLYRAFGAANMRADEMATIVSMLINNGNSDASSEFLNIDSIKRFETPMTTLAARNGLTYGYSLGNYQWLSNGVLFFGHGGDADGYLARYGYTRTTNQGYFFVINSYNNNAINKIRTLTEQWLTRDITTLPPPDIYTLENNHIKQITGEYQTVTNRFDFSKKRSLRIFADNNKLFTQIEGEAAIQLIPVNQKHFRRKNQPIATISIVKDTQGIPVLQGDLGNFRRISNIK